MYALIISLVPQLVSAASLWPFLFCSILVLAFLLRTLEAKTKKLSSLEKGSRLWAAALALGSTALLFVGSGHAADLNGYLNRGLSSTWLMLVIVVALGAEHFGRFSKVVGVIAVMLFSANVVWFALKIEENTAASQLRSKIVSEIVSNSRSFPDGSSLVVDAPCLLPRARFDTEVFCSSWDLKGALELKGLDLKDVQPLWDPTFMPNFQTGENQNSFFLIRFDDSGELMSVHEQIESDAPANPYKRKPGGKDFKTLDCLSIFTDSPTRKSNPDILTCLVNPL